MEDQPANTQNNGYTMSHDTPDNRNIVRKMLQAFENPDREGLLDTPKRVVKSWDTLFGGYTQNPKEILGTVFDSDNYDQMIVLRDIELFSTCEHHLLAFYGKVHIAYIPNGKVVGLSKLARLAECFARRLQIQERLTQQIADAVVEHLDCKGVGVVIEAKHMCMLARGVGKQNSVMVTSALRGLFKRDSSTRSEFFGMLNK